MSNAWPRVEYAEYADALDNARSESSLIATMTSEPTDAPMSVYVLSPDRRSGYVVRADGELVLVFSLERGRGSTIVPGAIADGATHLDCFDGYLPDLYARYGFVETHREPNWTPGGPDVVYMRFGA